MWTLRRWPWSLQNTAVRSTFTSVGPSSEHQLSVQSRVGCRCTSRPAGGSSAQMSTRTPTAQPQRNQMLSGVQSSCSVCSRMMLLMSQVTSRPSERRLMLLWAESVVCQPISSLLIQTDEMCVLCLLSQSLDGFVFALNKEGRFLYISETVSIYLGLSQVRRTCPRSLARSPWRPFPETVPNN